MHGARYALQNTMYRWMFIMWEEMQDRASRESQHSPWYPGLRPTCVSQLHMQSVGSLSESIFWQLVRAYFLCFIVLIFHIRFQPTFWFLKRCDLFATLCNVHTVTYDMTLIFSLLRNAGHSLSTLVKPKLNLSCKTSKSLTQYVSAAFCVTAKFEES